jgi:hypothetical protein
VGKENVIIEDLDECTLTIPFAVKCIYIKKIIGCHLKLAAVENATFVTDSTGKESKRSQIWLASH